jgi:hypothetical protein
MNKGVAQFYMCLGIMQAAVLQEQYWVTGDVQAYSCSTWVQE